MKQIKEFNVGDKVFWAKYGCVQGTKTCPVCFGSKGVVVVLGNGEQVRTDCNYCNIGYSGSMGYVEEYEYKSSVEEIVLTGKEISEGANGRECEYRYGSYCLRNSDVFKTQEAAEKRVLEIIKEVEDEQSRRIRAIKDNKVRSLSWEVGYHRREAKEAQKQYEYHSSKAILLKTK